MSLIPFATRYLGQNLGLPLPVAVYAALLAVTSGSFYFLIRVLATHNAHNPIVSAQYFLQRKKSLGMVVVYIACAALAAVYPRVALVIVVLLPGLYFLPDRALAIEGDRERR